MDVLVPSTPKRLRITQTMVDDFLIDPVLGAKVIMGVDLDAFQKSRLRTYWWVPDVIDSSGFGTGKSFEFFVFMNLRCCLIPDQWCAAYYQAFESGKQIFWPNYKTVRAPIFLAQLGRTDLQEDKEKASDSQGAACWTQFYKNGSKVMMPAPSWMQDALTQAGLSFNVVGIDEWTKVEAMGLKKVGNGANIKMHNGINKQILGRVRRACFNQHHPLWCNHRLFMATAESQAHPGYQRYKAFAREVAKGNPNFSLISYSFKDYSDLPHPKHHGKAFREVLPDWKTIETMLTQLTRPEVLREMYGIWARETTGWYTEAALARCVERGQAEGIEVETALAILNRALYRVDGRQATAAGERERQALLSRA